MTTALCPGSFDPPTNGHVDMIDRCVRAFDRVVVAVIDNPSKSPTFSADMRKTLIGEIFGDAVEVDSFSGLLADYSRSVDVGVVVKGLRALEDFGREAQMSQMNRHLSGMETVFMTTRPEYSFISSSLVKEVARLGGPMAGLVPDVVEKALKERFA